MKIIRLMRSMPLKTEAGKITALRNSMQSILLKNRNFLMTFLFKAFLGELPHEQLLLGDFFNLLKRKKIFLLLEKIGLRNFIASTNILKGQLSLNGLYVYKIK